MAGEPAGHLDTAVGTSILELLQELHRDTTTIVVTTLDLDVTAGYHQSRRLGHAVSIAANAARGGGRGRPPALRRVTGAP